MAHTLQERYSNLVDAKLRATMVTDRLFNRRYEGDPKAGSVKIPVRDTEVALAAYNKATGTALTHGTTTYLPILIDKDYAVNELIDGYDAAAVPDNLIADRLDSAGYSLGLQMEHDALTELRKGSTKMADTTALTKTTVYEAIVDARTQLSAANVPNTGRFLLVTPDIYALLLKDKDHFVHASVAGDNVIASGAVGRIAGFDVYESTQLASVAYVDTDESIKQDTSIEFVAGHPDWCCRVDEWQVPVQLNDLKGSGTFIGASAVQGRKIYAHKVTKAAAVVRKCKA